MPQKVAVHAEPGTPRVHAFNDGDSEGDGAVACLGELPDSAVQRFHGRLRPRIARQLPNVVAAVTVNEPVPAFGCPRETTLTTKGLLAVHLAELESERLAVQPTRSAAV